MKFNIKTFLITADGESGDSVDDTGEVKDNLDTFKKAGFEDLVESVSKTEKESDDKVVIPFQQLTRKEHKITKLCFPSKTGPENFKWAVPLEIASLMALCNEKSYFKSIKILCDNSTYNPLLSEFMVVGFTKGEYSRDTDGTYLIGRWGVSKLKELIELEDQAKQIAVAELTRKIREQQSQLDLDLGSVDSKIDDWLERDEYLGYSIL